MTMAGPGATRPDLSEIEANLFVGEYPQPADVAWLREHLRVSAVVSLQDDADLAKKNVCIEVLEAAYALHGLSFHRVPVPDGDTRTLAAHLDALVARLDDLLGAGERVYLHCNAGMNRAPTVAIAYLHARRGLPLAEARDFVKRRRPCVPYMSVLHAHYGLFAGPAG